jgi:hypothetical protein
MLCCAIRPLLSTILCCCFIGEAPLTGEEPLLVDYFVGASKVAAVFAVADIFVRFKVSVVAPAFIP